MADLFIKNGLVLTMEPDTFSGLVIENGAVAVTGNIIVAVGKTSDLEAEYGNSKRVIDASGKIIMPGLIMTHSHMAYPLGHNMPVDFTQLKSFWDMLMKMGWEWLEDVTTSDDVYAATMYSAMKMLKSGNTTVCETVEAPNALPGPLMASARAIEEIGIRAQVGYEITERVPGEDILKTQSLEWADKGIQENLDFLTKYPKNNGSRIEARPAIHAAYTVSEETLKKVRTLADALDCGIQIHVSEIPRAFLIEKYGKSAPKYLEDAGLLGPDVIAGHSIDLNDEDLEILRRNDVKVSYTPMTDSLGGNPVARIPEMLEKNMNVTIGHDCFFTLDISEYMRYTYLVQKNHHHNPLVVSPFQMLDMVTMQGARALGVEDQIGSLKVGKKADVILIEPDSPSPTTAATYLSYFTMTFQGKHVHTVIVDGNIVVEEYKMKNVNEALIRKNCVEHARQLWKRNGIEV